MNDLVKHPYSSDSDEKKTAVAVMVLLFTYVAGLIKKDKVNIFGHTFDMIQYQFIYITVTPFSYPHIYKLWSKVLWKVFSRFEFSRFICWIKIPNLNGFWIGLAKFSDREEACFVLMSIDQDLDEILIHAEHAERTLTSTSLSMKGTKTKVGVVTLKMIYSSSLKKHSADTNNSTDPTEDLKTYEGVSILNYTKSHNLEILYGGFFCDKQTGGRYGNHAFFKYEPESKCSSFADLKDIYETCSSGYVNEKMKILSETYVY